MIYFFFSCDRVLFCIMSVVVWAISDSRRRCMLDLCLEILCCYFVSFCFDCCIYCMWGSVVM